ncbi:MAG: hypothetical protein ACYC7D_05325 [Nitrososphaerales archaeon]
MRIGSLNANLLKWQPTDTRDVFNYALPGAMMPYSFDLNSSLRTIVCDGVVYDTSTASLAQDIAALEAMFRTGQLVWLDASDQFAALCAFGKIAKLQGPTLDVDSTGIYAAKFTVEFWPVLPWGTTLFNPWKSQGFKMRDIDGVGSEYMLDPTQMHCNYTIDSVNKVVSWEFIVENQNAFTNATSVQEVNCDSLGSGVASPSNPVAVNNPDGVQNPFSSITIDTLNYKEGVGALKGTISSPAASSYYGMGYDLGTSGINISAYDRLRLWYRCDQSGQGNSSVLIIDTSGHYRVWYFMLQAANTWMNVEVSLASYSTQNANPNFAAIRWIGVQIESAAIPPASINLWVDDIRVEVGYINHCEDTSGWNLNYGSGGTFSNDTVVFKEGLASLKCNATSDVAGRTSVQYIPRSGTFNLTTYDFYLLWARADFGGASTGNYVIQIQDTAGSYNWTYNNCNANQWYRFVVPLRNPTSTSGTPSLADAQYFLVTAIGTASIVSNLWIDEIAVDTGKWTYLECYLPDNVSSWTNAYDGASLFFYAWTGASYALANTSTPDGSNSAAPAYVFTLDGTSFQNVYSNITEKSSILYVVGSTGTTQNLNKDGQEYSGGSGVASTITYSSTYGTNSRIVFAVKLPPATSDSTSGNYPSNDLSGMQAINKVRLKIEVYYASEDTTYSGFNAL